MNFEIELTFLEPAGRASDPTSLERRRQATEPNELTFLEPAARASDPTSLERRRHATEPSQLKRNRSRRSGRESTKPNDSAKRSGRA